MVVPICTWFYQWGIHLRISVKLLLCKVKAFLLPRVPISIGKQTIVGRLKYTRNLSRCDNIKSRFPLMDKSIKSRYPLMDSVTQVLRGANLLETIMVVPICTWFYQWGINLRISVKLLLCKVKAFLLPRVPISIGKQTIVGRLKYTRNLSRCDNIKSRFLMHSVGNLMFKVKNRNTRTRCEICQKLTITTPEQRH